MKLKPRAIWSDLNSYALTLSARLTRVRQKQLEGQEKNWLERREKRQQENKQQELLLPLRSDDSHAGIGTYWLVMLVLSTVNLMCLKQNGKMVYVGTDDNIMKRGCVHYTSPYECCSLPGCNRTCLYNHERIPALVGEEIYMRMLLAFLTLQQGESKGKELVESTMNPPMASFV